jgi:hypothetical protein
MATEAIAIRHSLIIKDLANLMWLVAINAGRQNILFFFPEFSLNNFTMHLFDQSMALSAGGGNIGTRDGGSRIGVRQYPMG